MMRKISFLSLLAAVLVLGISTVKAADFSWEIGDTVSPEEWADRDVDAEPGTYYDGKNLYFIESTGEASSKTRVNNWKCYKGTSMDDLSEVSSFSADFSRPHGDDRYWLSGLWVDETSGIWYTTVHDEFNYVNTSSIPEHERYVMYATSDDKGATWTLKDVIISSDDPAVDSEDNPGRYQPFGCGDQKMFVDTRSGYIYIYYMKAWSDRETGYMYKTCHVARSPISAKMAVGSWQKWYNGSWSEPGIGGHDSTVFSPPSTGTYVAYNTYLERYIAIGLQRETSELFVTTCSNIEKQDWTQPEYFADKTIGGYYNWGFDTTTMNRHEIGKNFRFYRSSHNYAPMQYNPVTLDSSKEYFNKYYYPNYSFLKGTIYAHDSIMEMIPDYAYRCDFSDGCTNMDVVSGKAELSVLRQQKLLSIAATSNSVVIDNDAPDMHDCTMEFSVIEDSAEDFGAIVSYDESGNYEMLHYRQGTFTWETRDNDPIKLFDKNLICGKAYSIRMRLNNGKLNVQIDGNTMYDGNVYETSVGAGKYGFTTAGTLLVDNISRYEGTEIVIDGAVFAMDYEPELTDDTIMLPLERLADIFNIDLSDNTFTVIDRIVQINGKKYVMPRAPYNRDGYLMVPAEFLSCFGITTEVSLSENRVNITSNGNLKIKLQQLKPMEINEARQTGKNGIADYFENYRTDYITEGKLMYKDNSDGVPAARVIYRRNESESASRIYQLTGKDIETVELKTLTYSSDVSKHIECYISKDGLSWTEITMTALNQKIDSSTGMYNSDYCNMNVPAGYRYFKTTFLAEARNWSGQLGYVIINRNSANIDAIEESIALPEYATSDLSLPTQTSDGAVIKWTVPKNDYIDSNGVLVNTPKLGEGAQKINISADITYDGITETRTFTVIVSEPSGCLVKGFTAASAGTLLQNIGKESEYGWNGGFTVTTGDAAKAFVASTPYGNMVSLAPGTKSGAKNYEVSRELSGKMDFDVDKTYYIVWNQRMEGYSSARYQNQRLVLKGASVNGSPEDMAGISIIQSVLTSANIANNVFDNDYYPAYMMLKFGSVTNYPTLKKFSFVKGQTYTMVMRIDASAEGKERVYMKAYPTGTKVPDEWYASLECEITGSVNKIILYGLNDGTESDIWYGNLMIDSIAAGEETAYQFAEAAVRAGNVESAKAQLQNLADGAWKNLIYDEIADIDGFSISAVTFKQNDIRISKLTQTGAVEVSVTVTNNTDTDKECNMSATIHTDGQLKEIKQTPYLNIGSGCSETFNLTIDNTNALGSDSCIKVYLWGSKMDPLATATVMDEDLLIQQTATAGFGN